MDFKAKAPVDISKLYANIKKEIGLDDPSPIPWVLPTGSLSLDRITGVGGYPGGRIIELYGPESGGKSTLAMHACVEAEKLGVPFAYIDTEQSLLPRYFHELGLKGAVNKDWMHVTPETGEDAFATIKSLLEGGVGFVVVDSVAAMTPKSELAGDFGDANMGAQARMMSQGMRMLTGLIGQKEAIVLFVNQTREKIGVMYGNPETTTGGKALKFYASIRISVRTVLDPIEDAQGNAIGRFAKCKTVKNKVAPPMRECELPIIWGKGIDRNAELFDVCLVEGIVSKSSSYFTYKDVKVNGRVNFLNVIPEFKEELQADLNRKWALKKEVSDEGL